MDVSVLFARTLRRANDMGKGTWTIHYRYGMLTTLRAYEMLTTFHAVEGSSNYWAPTAFLECGFPSTRRAWHRISIEHTHTIRIGVAISVDVRNANSSMGLTFEPTDNSAHTYTWNYRFLSNSTMYVHWLNRAMPPLSVWREHDVSSRMRALMNELKNIRKSLIEQTH